MLGLAEVCRIEHRYPEAEPLYKEALALFERIGIEEKVVATWLALADVYASEHRLAEAESAYRKAIAVSENGAKVPGGTLDTALSAYAAFLRQQERQAEAEKLEMQARDLKKKSHE